MMKKTISILSGMVIILLVAVFFLPKSGGEMTLPSEQKTDRDILHLRFGHNTPVGSALHEASVRFAETVEKKSNGKVRIQVFPAQQLGNDHQMVEMARRGELDILLTPTAKMSVAVPSMQYADLPFFFPSREDVYDMLDGEPGKMLLDDLKEIGLVGVTFWENGFKHFTGNTPLLRPDDFQGKKIRVMKSRIIMEQFKAFGAEPVPIDFHMTKQALADGVVDGEENPLVAIVRMGFHEVQSDLTLSEHAFLGYVFSISAGTYEKLPLEICTLLTETAKEITPWERRETQKHEAEFLQTIEKAGVRIHRLSAADRKKFASLTAHIARKYEEVIGADVMSKTQELLYQKYGPDPAKKEDIVIGLDADLSMGGKSAGLAIKRGAQLAVDDINAEGGILGKKVVLIAKDHRAVATRGVENIREFASRPDVVGIIGGKHSAVIATELPYIREAGVPYMVPWAAASVVTESSYENNPVFRVSLNDSIVSKYLLEYTLKHYKNPAIIVENSIWGRGSLEKMEAYNKTDNRTCAAKVVINRGQEDFTKEITTLRQSGVDSIIMVLNSVEGSKVFNAMADSGLNIPIVSHWGIIGGNFYAQNKKRLKTIDLKFIQTFSFVNPTHPTAKRLAESYMKTYGKRSIREITAPSGVAQAYDAVQLLALAIKKAGSTRHDKVRAALENLPAYEGVVKSYAPAFTPQRHDTMQSGDFFMAKFGADGLILPAEAVKKR